LGFIGEKRGRPQGPMPPVRGKCPEGTKGVGNAPTRTPKACRRGGPCGRPRKRPDSAKTDQFPQLMDGRVWDPPLRHTIDIFVGAGPRPARKIPHNPPIRRTNPKTSPSRNDQRRFRKGDYGIHIVFFSPDTPVSIGFFTRSRRSRAWSSCPGGPGCTGRRSSRSRRTSRRSRSGGGSVHCSAHRCRSCRPA